MLVLRKGASTDASSLSSLIFSSAPILLPYLYGDKSKAISYITKAAQVEDGQYSARRHTVACKDNKVIACITLWDNNLPMSFHSHTVKSVKEFLSPEALLHLVRANIQIGEVFAGPKAHELCVGHLAVAENSRGQGVGLMLVNYAIEQAKLLNKTHLVLDVDSDNEIALNFYLGLGFVLLSKAVFIHTQQSFFRLAFALQ
jgi:ribosomal protein S18 acetylase RimI-like enzyme